jgi:hypothetical protein
MGFASFFEDVCLRYQENLPSREIGMRGPAGESTLGGAHGPSQRPKQASSFLILCFGRLRELYSQVGQNLVGRFVNGDWRPLVIRLDALGQRLDRFQLDVLWKTNDQKMAHARMIQEELSFLTDCRKKLFEVLDEPFLEMSDVLSEIRMRLTQEKNPPLHKTETEWCQRVEEDCRRWGELKAEADHWIELLEKKSLGIEDFLWEDYAKSAFRVEDKPTQSGHAGHGPSSQRKK